MCITTNVFYKLEIVKRNNLQRLVYLDFIGYENAISHLHLQSFSASINNLIKFKQTINIIPFLFL